MFDSIDQANAAAARLEENRTEIDRTIAAQIDWLTHHGPAADDPFIGAIYHWLEHYLYVVGKRFHGLTVILSYRAAGRTDVDAVLPVAAALQLYHHHTLVHDDIYDGDVMRRGLPTSHVHLASLFESETAGACDPRPFASHGARSGVIAAFAYGKICRALANRAVSATTLDGARVLKILMMLEEHDLWDNVGQLLDVYHEGSRLPSSEACLQNVWLKTGRLFEVCARAGAVAAGADASITNALVSWAGNLAVAYQLKDDLEDTVGNSEKGLGRGIGVDLVALKPTYLLSLANELADAQDRATLSAWLNREQDYSVDEFSALIDRTGARRVTQLKVEELISAGVSTVGSLGTVGPDVLAEVTELSRYAISDEYWHRPLASGRSTAVDTEASGE
ncbi:polyprenyl synthetase family protein [Propionibacterium acidifaciens]|uniref:polyprenyl synthetase family protein n=1 Tax=Propionibacterium acidifaciens TaxID=556499 RepID=UPI0028E6B3BF|nr:polyprenyl synthetase family protein [Propionibacterium acidifaciens]